MKFHLGNTKRRDHLEDLDIDGRRISKWILSSILGCGVDSRGSGQGPVAHSIT